MKNVEDIYPLSPLQDGLLTHVLSAPSSRVGFEQTTFVLRGEVEPRLLERSWQRLVDRHPMLRTCFVETAAGRRVQVVRRQVELPMEQHDWRGLEPEERARRTAELRAEVEARGFDPRVAPLLHVALVRLEDAAWRLVWSYSHLLIDGWCRSLLLAELFTTYRALADRRAPSLDEAVPYRSFIEWLEEREPAAEEKFWSRRLGDVEEPTPLMLDRLPGDADGEEGAEAATSGGHVHAEEGFDEAATERLESFARGARVTLNTLVQAAWALYLARLSGRSKVVHGTTVSGRPADLPGSDEIVGVFANNLPVALEVPADVPLAEWLGTVQRELAEMRAYEYCAPGQIQGWSGVPSGRRLFESLVLFQNYPVEGAVGAGRSSGLAVGGYDFRFETGFPLTLVAAPGRRLTLRLYHRRGGLAPGVAREVLADLRHILETMPEHGDTPVGRLPAGPGRAVEIDGEGSARPALTAGGPLPARAAALGRELERRNLRPGDAVLLPAAGATASATASAADGWSPAEVALAALAIWRAGGVVVPAGHDEADLWTAGRAAGTRWLVAPPELAEAAPAGIETAVLPEGSTTTGNDEVPGNDERPGGGEPDSRPAVRFADGGELDRSTVAAQADALAEGLDLGAEVGVALAPGVEPWSALLVSVAALRAGSRVTSADGEGSASVSASPETSAVDQVLVLDPGTARSWSTVAAADDDAAPARESMPRHLVVAAGTATPGRGLAAAAAEMVSSACEDRADRSEAASCWLLFTGPATGGLAALAPFTPDRVPALEGHLGGVSPTVAGEDGRSLPAGATGRLAFRAPGGVRVTDVSARALPAGRVEVLGAANAAAEVAAVLRRSPRVLDAAALAQSGSVHAFVVPRPGAAAEEEAERLHRHLRGLPAELHAAAVTAVEALPRDAAGGLDPASLRGLEVRARRVPEPPSTPLELKLVQLFEETLGLRPVGVDESFFELGGQSLAALRLVAAVGGELGPGLALADLVAHPTVAALAAHLESVRDGGGDDPALLVPIRPAGRRPPFFCVHAAGGTVASYIDLAYLLGPEQPFYGLRARGLRPGEEPLDDLEVMAALYVDEIRGVQPTGPYRLGGWSFGGLVAWEMARQLRAAGDEVAVLALLDSGAGTRAWGGAAEGLDHADYLVAFLSWLLPLSADELRRQGGEEEQIDFVISELKRRGRFPADLGPAEGRRLFEVYRAHADAAQGYEPRPAPGRPLLVRSRQGLASTGADPHLGWEGLPADGLEVVEVDGAHRDLMRRPWVEAVAARLAEALDRAESGAAETGAAESGASEPTASDTATPDTATPRRRGLRRRRGSIGPAASRPSPAAAPEEEPVDQARSAAGGPAADPELRAAAERVSPVAVSFLDFVGRRPETWRRDRFPGLDVSEDDILAYPLQPWPQFVDAAAARRMAEASVGLLRLVKAVPERLVGTDAESLASGYGLDAGKAALVASAWRCPGGVETAIGRGDFVLTEEGLRLVEMNVSGQLGGWETPAYAGRFDGVEPWCEFRRGLGLPSFCRSVPRTLFQHLAESFLAHGRGPAEGTMNVAVVRLDASRVDAPPRALRLLDEELAHALEAVDGRLHGRVRFCHHRDLESRGGVLHLGGEPVRLVVEHNRGMVSAEVLAAWSSGQAQVVNGPPSWVLSDKRNLALLSEHAASDHFDDGERRLIRSHVPWTRLARRGPVEYQGGEHRLEELVAARRRHFVLKPCRGLRGEGVVLGRNTGEAAWRDAVETAFAEVPVARWVVQELCPSLPLAGQVGEEGWGPLDAVWGLFALGGRWGGGFLRTRSRGESDGVVNSARGARATLLYEVAGDAADAAGPGPGPAQSRRAETPVPEEGR